MSDLEQKKNYSQYHKNVITFGKHKGRTFDGVFKNDEFYVDWITKLKTNDIKNENVKDFFLYCCARKLIEN